MYRKIDDLIADWNNEKDFTLKIFSKITDEVKSHKENENIRTLERLAWHITQTLTEMPFRAGLFETDVLDNQPIPNDFNEIIEIYKKQSDALINAIKRTWNDTELDDNIEIYGQQWKKNKMLSITVKHQIHHRGQMTILMRLQHIVVPGTYGPAKEEWIQFGMEPHQ
jgi:uncharacterized damage-inducible protein DinB